MICGNINVTGRFMTIDWVTLIASTSQVTVGAISIMLQANPDNVGLTPRTAEQYV